MVPKTEHPLYGILAEFEDPEQLTAAVLAAAKAGFKKFDAYTPFPIEGLAEVIKPRATRLPSIVLAGGILGGLAGYSMLYYSAVIDYPINIGGRPYHSWPSFIPITFELTVLGAALGAVLGMLALNGLPMPYHPVFNVPRFEAASHNRFFLCIESADPVFETEKTRQFLMGLKPYGVYEVEP